MDNATHARIEQQLAIAHRALRRASDLADEKNDMSWSSDLDQLCIELRRLLLDSLDKRRPRRRLAQQTLPNRPR